MFDLASNLDRHACILVNDLFFLREEDQVFVRFLELNWLQLEFCLNERSIVRNYLNRFPETVDYL